MALYGQNYGQNLAKFLAIILVTTTTLYRIPVLKGDGAYMDCEFNSYLSRLWSISYFLRKSHAKNKHMFAARGFITFAEW